MNYVTHHIPATLAEVREILHTEQERISQIVAEKVAEAMRISEGKDEYIPLSKTGIARCALDRLERSGEIEYKKLKGSGRSRLYISRADLVRVMVTKH